MNLTHPLENRCAGSWGHGQATPVERVGGQELPGTGMDALAAAVTQKLGTILPRLACPRASGTPLLASVCSHKVPSLTGVLCMAFLRSPGR